MFKKAFSRSLLGLLVVAAPLLFAATPAQAYGAENYQVGFSGTAFVTSGGFSFGFWGWCAFGGGTGTLPTSGTTGDCNYALYIHSSPGGVTCEQSVDVSSWAIKPSSATPFSDFFVTGTASVHPAGAAVCFGLFPGVFPPTFRDFDTLVPAAPGHYNLNGVSLGGATFTEFQVQVAAIPQP
jgi:hypothetical protein